MATELQQPPDGTRWRWVAVAVLAALGAWQLAPASWPAGDAVLRVSLEGEPQLERQVRIGSGDEFSWRSPDDAVDSPLVRVSATFPEHGQVTGLVTLRARERVSTDLGDIRVELELSDGRTELIPVLLEGIVPGSWFVARRPPVRSGVVLGLMAFVIVLWVTGAVPLWVTALFVPLVVVVGGVSKATGALAPFFHPIIALFFGGFLMAEAMKRVGLDRRVAIGIVALAGRSPLALFAAVMATSAFLSMWMSNTASTALLIPIALAVTEPLKSPGYRRAIVLGLAYAATVGGIGSAIGTPANLLAIEFLGSYAGRELAFVDWFFIGLPVLAVTLPIIGIYLWWRLDVDVDRDAFKAAREVARSQRAELGPPDRAQLSVLAVFSVIVSLWLTQQWHELHPGIVALGGAALLALLGRIKGGDLQRISWEALLTFGGGLALGSVMVDSGTSDWLASCLAGLGTLPPLLGTLAVASFALALTTVASNTASAAIVIPLAIPLAGVLGLEPITLVLIVAVASSIDFALVIGTPPTMLAYSTGLFTPPRIFRIGIVLDLVCLALLVTVVRWIWGLIGISA